MPTSATASPDDIDLTTLSATLRRAGPKLIVLSLIAAGLTYLGLSLIAPQFQAQSEMAIVARGGTNPFAAPNAHAGNAELVASRMDKEAVNTHIRALMSSELAERMVAEHGLAERAEFNPVLGPVDTMDGLLRGLGLVSLKSGETEADRVLTAFTRRLEVYSPKESRAITIRFTSTDPQLSADVANGIAEAYRARLAKATVVETDGVQQALAPRIAQLTGEVGVAEAAVASFRSSAGLLRGGASKTPVNEQQLGDLTTELTRVNAARSAAEARARTARDLMRRGNPEIIPEVQRSPLISSLIQQRVTVERDLLKLSASMKPAHPVIRQLNADLTAVKRQISGEIANIVASLDKEAFVAAEQEAAIRGSLDTIKIEVAGNTTDEVELRQLEAIAATKRAELERLQSQFEANRARADSGVVPVEAQILTRARPSSVAVFPKKLPYTVLVLAATLLFGTAIVITIGLAKGARSGGTARRGHAGLRHEIAAAVAAPAPHTAAFGPAARSSQTGLPLGPATRPRGPVGSPFTVLDTPAALAARIATTHAGVGAGHRSLIAGDGDPARRALVAVELAEALAGNGHHALLIDWSLTEAGIARHVGVERFPGLMDLLTGRASFADIVRWVPGSSVHVIASGTGRPFGFSHEDTEQLNLVLDALDEAYDHVVIVADSEAARTLFELTEGRLDTGVLVGDEGGPGGRVLTDPAHSFLGFETQDIDLIRLVARRPATGRDRAPSRAASNGAASAAVR